METKLRFKVSQNFKITITCISRRNSKNIQQVDSDIAGHYIIFSRAYKQFGSTILHAKTTDDLPYNKYQKLRNCSHCFLLQPLNFRSKFDFDRITRPTVHFVNCKRIPQQVEIRFVAENFIIF